MKQQLCVVRDVKSELYGRPFFVPSTGMAIRSFDDEVNRDAPDNVMHQHPGDFALFHIGEYDEAFGLVTSLECPVLLIEGMQVIRKGLQAVSKVSRV